MSTTINITMLIDIICTYPLGNVERSPEQRLEALACLRLGRALDLCDEPVACVIHDDVEPAEVLLDTRERRVDLLDGSYVQRQDEQLR